MSSERDLVAGIQPEIKMLPPWISTRLTVDPESGCWMWSGTAYTYNYGPYKVTHEMFFGRTPKGHDLHHICWNGSKGCCNPLHLEIIPTSRHRQMHARENVATLTVDQAREIREELLPDLSLTTQEIADMFGVHRNIVERIGMGRIWSDIAPGPLEYPHVCGWCGVEFTTTSRRKRYCSTVHQQWFADRQVYLRKRGAGSYIRPKRSARQAEEYRS